MLPSLKLPGVPRRRFVLALPGDQTATKGGEVAFQSASLRLGSDHLSLFEFIYVYHWYSIVGTRTEILPLPSFNYDKGQGMHLVSMMTQRSLRSLSASASEN